MLAREESGLAHSIRGCIMWKPLSSKPHLGSFHWPGAVHAEPCLICRTSWCDFLLEHAAPRSLLLPSPLGFTPPLVFPACPLPACVQSHVDGGAPGDTSPELPAS